MRLTRLQKTSLLVLPPCLPAMAHAEGVVPYKEWPEGVKGHFIIRTPPEGFVCE